MKEQALKLADELAFHQGELSMWTRNESCRMIRRLVEELDKQTYKADLLENRLKVIVGSKPTITKLDDKLVAVTMTDDEHRITEVLWEAQKPLTDEQIDKLADEYLSDYFNMQETIEFARAILRKAGIE